MPVIYNRKSQTYSDGNPSRNALKIPPLPLSPEQRRQAEERKKAKVSGSLIAAGTIFFGLMFSWNQLEAGRKVISAYSSVKFGMSTDDVLSIVGEPSNKQEMKSTYGSSEYWYYSNVQICFNNGKVSSINRY